MRISDMTSLTSLPTSGANVPVVKNGDTTNYKFDIGTFTGTGGAALIGTSAATTVQAELDKIGTKDLGTLSNTGDAPFTINVTASGNSGGASDWRSLLHKLTYSGAYGTTGEITGVEWQTEYVHTAGTVTFAYGQHGYNSLGTGTAGQTTGSITSSRGIEWHTANKSSNAQAIATAINFYSGDVDLDRSGVNGTIGTHDGFFCGNLGHASRVTVAAIGYDCANMTAGAPVTAAFRSQMASGTGKWAFLATASAASALAGALRIGDNTVPGDLLEVNGYAKLTADGTITAVGGYHEIVSANNDYVLHVRNKHASAPQGLRLRFTAASPNNTTQQFLLCEDSTTTRLVIWSNGNVVNSNNSYGAISDKRLKTAIKDSGPQLQDIRSIRVRKYKMKADGNDGIEHIGLIAQEVEKVSPGLIFEDDGGMKGVNYSVLYMKAVKALQELADIVEKQGEEIAALKAVK